MSVVTFQGIIGLTKLGVRKYWFLVFWFSLCAFLFRCDFLHYKKAPQFYYLRRMLGVGICISRGTAALLNIAILFIVLPMGRNIISLIRVILPLWLKLSLGYIFPSSKMVHMVVAYTILIASVAHSVSHFANAYNFSKNYMSSFPEVNLASYRGQSPVALIFSSVPGITGTAMLVILCLISVTSLKCVRKQQYEIFYYTHHSSAFLLILLLIHPLSGVLKGVGNLDSHPPGCLFYRPKSVIPGKVPNNASHVSEFSKALMSFQSSFNGTQVYKIGTTKHLTHENSHKVDQRYKNISLLSEITGKRKRSIFTSEKPEGTYSTGISSDIKQRSLDEILEDNETLHNKSKYISKPLNSIYKYHELKNNSNYLRKLGMSDYLNYFDEILSVQDTYDVDFEEGINSMQTYEDSVHLYSGLHNETSQPLKIQKSTPKSSSAIFEKLQSNSLVTEGNNDHQKNNNFDSLQSQRMSFESNFYKGLMVKYLAQEPVIKDNHIKTAFTKLNTSAVHNLNISEESRESPSRKYDGNYLKKTAGKENRRFKITEHPFNRRCQKPPLFVSIESQTWIWVLMSFFYLLVNFLIKYCRGQKKVEVLSVREYSCNVLELTLRKSGFECFPGQYILLCCPNISKYEWHPFSVAQCPTTETDKFTILIRTNGNWCQKLKKLYEINKFLPPDPNQLGYQRRKTKSSSLPCGTFHRDQKPDTYINYSYNKYNSIPINLGLINNNNRANQIRKVYSSEKPLKIKNQVVCHKMIGKKYSSIIFDFNEDQSNNERKCNIKLFKSEELTKQIKCTLCNCQKNNKNSKISNENFITIVSKNDNREDKQMSTKNKNSEMISNNQKHFYNSQYIPNLIYSEILEPPSKINKIRLLCDGPLTSPNEAFVSYPIILGIAGGIGITPLISSLNYLIYSNKLKPWRLHIVWIVRELQLVVPLAHSFRALIEQFWERQQEDRLEFLLHCTASNTDSNFEQYFSEKYPKIKARLRRGRPDWKILFPIWMDTYKRSSVGVFCCGPKSLSNEINNYTLQAVAKGLKFTFHHESFS